MDEEVKNANDIFRETLADWLQKNFAGCGKDSETADGLACLIVSNFRVEIMHAWAQNLRDAHSLNLDDALDMVAELVDALKGPL